MEIPPIEAMPVSKEETISLLIASSDDLRRYVEEQDDHPLARILTQAVYVSINLVLKSQENTQRL